MENLPRNDMAGRLETASFLGSNKNLHPKVDFFPPEVVFSILTAPRIALLTVSGHVLRLNIFKYM